MLVCSERNKTHAVTVYMESAINPGVSLSQIRERLKMDDSVSSVAESESNYQVTLLLLLLLPILLLLPLLLWIVER